jgi:hypothetical protein
MAINLSLNNFQILNISEISENIPVIFVRERTVYIKNEEDKDIKDIIKIQS